MAKKELSKQINAKVRPIVKNAVLKAVDKGLAQSEADYVRGAVVKELRKDGLL